MGLSGKYTFEDSFSFLMQSD